MIVVVPLRATAVVLLMAFLLDPFAFLQMVVVALLPFAFLQMVALVVVPLPFLLDLVMVVLRLVALWGVQRTPYPRFSRTMLGSGA